VQQLQVLMQGLLQLQQLLVLLLLLVLGLDPALQVSWQLQLQLQQFLCLLKDPKLTAALAGLE
jgi:hypothetical protein